jgi:trypsin
MGVYVQYVPYEDCLKNSPGYEMVLNDDYHMCYGNPGKDSCYGDSGGPLADAKTIYGIVSFGDECGKASSVYVKVSYYRKWIDHIMKLH